MLARTPAVDAAVNVTAPPASPGFAQASCLDEQIKHIIRKLHAVFVQPQHQQDKLLRGNITLNIK
jgi:hypothetical protein